MSKNIQAIDGALNCTYDVFTVTEEDFRMVFPGDGQDIEFAEDFFERLGKDAQRIWDRLWLHRADKKSISGIHGTLFSGLKEKKEFYPTKCESEMVTGL